MFTQCPQCHTNFSINDRDLTAAGGKVQCGKCSNTFNALYTLSKHPLSSSEPAEILEISSIDRLSNDNVAESYQLTDTPTPQTATTSRRQSALKWGVLGMLLCALLFTQASYFLSDKLAQGYPILRPWLEQFCAASGCQLSLQRATDKISIINRDVRSHPTVSRALLINVTLQNNASFTQPYPQLKLSFFDINHTLLATRAFQPDEYLSQEIDINSGFPAGKPLSATLELIDPDKQAINFEFELK
ncbi:hypothetical protein MNBD_GAMMA17-496 [hydrothermal vent metagenome]|uniref:Zinc finger/thioredoxin putative domain-containing protein n=1 Tax=hydrothermal vent metagenome TaxID=652676 RepID=A0A3B0ZX88_9ZZZZ